MDKSFGINKAQYLQQSNIFLYGISYENEQTPKSIRKQRKPKNQILDQSIQQSISLDSIESLNKSKGGLFKCDSQQQQNKPEQLNAFKTMNTSISKNSQNRKNKMFKKSIILKQMMKMGQAPINMPTKIKQELHQNRSQIPITNPISRDPQNIGPQCRPESEDYINELISTVFKPSSPIQSKKPSKQIQAVLPYLSSNNDPKLSSKCVDGDIDRDVNGSFDVKEILNFVMNSKQYKQLANKMEKQKSLKLKDYLRLTSLSLNKKERNKTNRSLCKSKSRAENLKVKSQSNNSASKAVIDKKQSLKLLKNAIHLKFTSTFKTAKTLLATISPPSVVSQFSDQINDRLLDQPRLVQDTYQDLVFMCNIHRIYENCIFISSNSLKKLMQNFQSNQKAGKLDKKMINYLDSTIRPQNH